MDKSEELCRLLGIEPQRLIKYSIGDDIFTIQDSTNKVNDVYFEIADRSPINGRYVTLIKESNIYPDLTKPSNFVKLLFFKFPNFNNEYYNILEFMSDNFVEIENINEYIESLYNQLKIDDKRIIKDIAKQAQATKWEY